MYSAYDEPLPFILQRQGLGWATTDLPIDRLPTLRGLDMNTWSTTLILAGGTEFWTLEQLIYSTHGSGAFRGVIGW